jgi:hypothetical protein
MSYFAIVVSRGWLVSAARRIRLNFQKNRPRAWSRACQTLKEPRGDDYAKSATGQKKMTGHTPLAAVNSSVVGTFETCRDVRSVVANGGKADVAGIAQFGRE